MKQPLKKIVVIGPESTGKSSLCKALAAHYHSLWCAEYAREYLEKNGTEYTFQDLLEIAKGQIALEEAHAQRTSDMLQPNYLFIDTDMYVMKVWSEYVYNRCHCYILEQLAKRRYDLYLLCNTDLPWTPDKLRECPNESERAALFRVYIDILQNQSTPFSLIEGSGNTRIAKAIAAIDAYEHTL